MPYRSVTTKGVTLLCFPPYDEAFAWLAQRQLEPMGGLEPHALQESLRRAYPNAIVRGREAMAALGEGLVWYAYRDGRYSPFTSEERWWERPDAARLDIDGQGRYIDANPAALTLIGLSRDALLAMQTGELTEPAVRPAMPWVWELLQDIGVLHSTSILSTPDGRRVPVEYRLVRDEAGPGRSVSYLRAVPLEDAARSTAADGPSAD